VNMQPVLNSMATSNTAVRVTAHKVTSFFILRLQPEVYNHPRLSVNLTPLIPLSFKDRDTYGEY